MIPPEVHARIRRLFFAEHWRIGTIVSELGVHPDTVRRAIESERFHNQLAPQIRATLLDPYKGFIAEVLERHPRLRSSRLFEMIRERGYPGSAVQLRRYVRTVRPARQREAYLRLQTLPAEQGQVDWGNFGKIRVGNASRNLSCFVLVLSWSRAIYARFALDQTLESFLRGHVESFHTLGGVPRSLLYDYVAGHIIIDYIKGTAAKAPEGLLVQARPGLLVHLPRHLAEALARVLQGHDEEVGPTELPPAQGGRSQAQVDLGLFFMESSP